MAHQGTPTAGTMTFDPTDARDDLELLERSRQGDRPAFGELVSKYYGSCVKLATFLLRDRAEAEDGVQQALEKAFQHLHQYLGEALDKARPFL
jgi:DNA-directed RNA polymerase specialized sigma24 family protein